MHAERRDYADPPLSVGAENTRSVQLGLQWAPQPNVQVSPFVALTRRSSQSEGDDYRDQQYGVTFQVNF